LAESTASRDTGGTPPEPGPLRTLLVAFAVCAVCATLVTASVVVLRPLQHENQQRDRERKVRALVTGLPGLGELLSEAGEAELELRVVELASGAYAPSVDPEVLLSGRDQELESSPLPPERDLAGIGHRPRYAPVYLLRRSGALHTLVLPVHGQGYLSTIRGYLALAGDGNTVRGITFVEHEETPGLGSEIESPAWRARWSGKRLRDERGEVRIRVVREAQPVGSAQSPHRVQGISGATRTSAGVSDLVRFWVGPDGFGPYLERIRQGGDV
jgi:Na+-transporting NADH:ubiquinone oxidoreductase subunit C